LHIDFYIYSLTEPRGFTMGANKSKPAIKNVTNFNPEPAKERLEAFHAEDFFIIPDLIETDIGEQKQSVALEQGIEAIGEYVSPVKERLKALYAADNTIPALIRTEEKQEQSIDEYYVNLQMVIKEDDENKYQNAASDKVGGEKQPIVLAQMFDAVGENDATNKLLVLGGAGVGKSTLVHSMSYKWAKDGLWEDKFDFVIRVRLKEILNQGWKEGYKREELRGDLLSCFIDYCLYRQTENITQMVDGFSLEEIRDLLNNHQDKLLLLVDGYDEVDVKESCCYIRWNS